MLQFMMLTTWTRAYPGVWEVPLVMWNDLKEGRCSMADACNNPSTAEVIAASFHLPQNSFNKNFIGHASSVLTVTNVPNSPKCVPFTWFFWSNLPFCQYFGQCQDFKSFPRLFCSAKSPFSIMILHPQGVYYMIMKNFQRHYNTNRAPFGLSYHPAWSVLSVSSETCLCYISPGKKRDIGMDFVVKLKQMSLTV